MINKPVVNHLLSFSSLLLLLLFLLYSRLRWARPATGYYPPPMIFFCLPAHTTWLSPSHAMNFAGIAVLTEPDASRAPRIIGCIRCTGGRGGVTHLLATIAISHPLSPARQPLAKGRVPSFFRQIGHPARAYRANRDRDTLLLLVPLD